MGDQDQADHAHEGLNRSGIKFKHDSDFLTLVSAREFIPDAPITLARRYLVRRTASAE